MLYKILSTKKLHNYTCLCLSVLFFNCSTKEDISVTICSIDENTNLNRINKFDSVLVMVEDKGFLTKTFKEVGKYVTDSLGSVTIKIDNSKIYDFSIFSKDKYGADMYPADYFKNLDTVKIKINSIK